MASKLALDPRIDPRIKAVFATSELPRPTSVASREEILSEEATASANARAEGIKAFLDAMDTEVIAPSKGLSLCTERFTSSPDGNSVNIQFIRPTNGKFLPCVYYIHGGGMATMSCYYGNYRAWGRMIAAQGVAVAMVDFRNAVHASTAPEVAPYPAGLNDCVSGLKWVHANAETLGIDTSRVIVAGESGGVPPARESDHFRYPVAAAINRVCPLHAKHPGSIRYRARHGGDFHQPHTAQSNQRFGLRRSISRLA
jgi:acetyl esterase